MQKQQKDKNNQTHEGGMSSRGVTRPIMNEGKQHSSDPMQMLQKHHTQTLWIYWMVILLGCWMILSPLTFNYGKATVEPAGGREVWLSLAGRISAMKWSDIISGIFLIIFGARSLKPDRPVSGWICCFTGVWLNIAPLIFWAPNAVAYLNDTLVGALVISLTILVAGMPNMILYMKMGSEVPAGWSYNPSSWAQRSVMIALGFAGWMVSRYLGAFQLGFIDQVWDPFFGESSRQVLTSHMSQSLVISDGALGALAYTFEFLMGWMGSPMRWRTMPWMVALFGILVIPLGLVHIFLVISQPVTVGAWCFFCLLAAAIMLPMIPLEVDEVIAMGQHMVYRTRKGDSFWKVFWKGGEPVEKNRDKRSPGLMQFPQHPLKIFKASIWGMSFPWTLVASVILGIWLMFAPAAFGIPIQASTANVDHLCGALIIVVAVICMGEVLRRGRYLNIVLGLIVAVIPWFLGNGNFVSDINGTIAGVLVILLSFPRGPKREQYGLWDKFVR